MIEVKNYKCPILNEHYRGCHTYSYPSVDVLVKLEDCDSSNLTKIICPMHETGPDCFVKLSKYQDKRNEIIEGYKEENRKYREIKTTLIKEKKAGRSIDINLDEEIERLKKQELQQVDGTKNTLCILVRGFKELK